MEFISLEELKNLSCFLQQESHKTFVSEEYESISSNMNKAKLNFESMMQISEKLTTGYQDFLLKAKIS